MSLYTFTNTFTNTYIVTARRRRATTAASGFRHGGGNRKGVRRGLRQDIRKNNNISILNGGPTRSVNRRKIHAMIHNCCIVYKNIRIYDPQITKFTKNTKYALWKF